MFSNQCKQNSTSCYDTLYVIIQVGQQLRVAQSEKVRREKSLFKQRNSRNVRESEKSGRFAGENKYQMVNILTGCLSPLLYFLQ